jgi:type III restriction enzyme
MDLKTYQTDALKALTDFLAECRIAGPKLAYESQVREPGRAQRLGRFAGGYLPLEGLPDAPYVCLRLPTGGGKTLLGAYAVGIARDNWIERDYPLVLWLTPTNIIRQQTAEALKNPRHAYRQALDEKFEGRVRVFDIADFPTIRPQDLRDNACVVVGTIQTLRVSNTEGRKVYAHHEDLETHFSGIPNNTPGLETEERGGARKIKFSFANLMHLHRPLMIVDEAHNAMTELSREMQARVNPAAIIEFTATPQLQSNILYNVRAEELKREEMIKLPINLSEHTTWQAAVSSAIATRASLAEKAEHDQQAYIRPIVLFQAQPRDEDVTVDVLKKHLIDNESVSKETIAVATGDQRGLDGIDLIDPACKIEYVITVEALKEGWDCSFAYVFCSVARIQSATSVEQLLGRVLRMPYARRRDAPELNKAYAHVSEPVFATAANALVDKLIAMGFDDTEAREAIEQAQPDLGEGLFAPRPRPAPELRHVVEIAPEAAEALRAESGGAIQFEPTSDGRTAIRVTGPLSERQEQAIVRALPSQARAGFTEAARAYRLERARLLSPAERGEVFVAPRLMAEVQGELVFADELFDDFDWSLLDYPATLTAQEFDVHESASEFEIDLDGRRLQFSPLGQQDRLILNAPVEGWDRVNLSIWLDKEIRQADIPPSQMLRWAQDALAHLVVQRGLKVAALWRVKYVLARKLAEKVKAARETARRQGYQLYLFSPGSIVSVSTEAGFRFHPDMFADVRKQPPGRYQFKNHYLGRNNIPLLSGKPNGEEMQCAMMLDGLPQVEYWVRNVARHPDAFRLPLATANFYPDFVAKLKDGRTVVVEYKGEMLAGEGIEDTNEKRAIGELWERSGAGLFLMVEKERGGLDIRGQLMAKLS